MTNSFISLSLSVSSSFSSSESDFRSCTSVGLVGGFFFFLTSLLMFVYLLTCTTVSILRSSAAPYVRTGRRQTCALVRLSHVSAICFPLNCLPIR